MAEEPNQNRTSDSTVYLCVGCGGNMEYDSTSQSLKCPYCGATAEIRSEGAVINEYDFDDVAQREEQSVWNQEVSVVKCEGCGAETVVERDQTALRCNYCGSSHVLESKQTAGIKPEAVIPFQIDKHRNRELFENWIKSRWLAPNNLKRMYQSDKVLAVYVPYWTYDANTDNYFTAEGGEHYYEEVERDGERVREQRTRWYHVQGSFQMFFDDVQVNASRNYHNDLMQKLEPYDMTGLKPYQPQYISGFMAERYSRGVVEGFDLAKRKIDGELYQEVRDRVRRRYDEVRSIQIDTGYSDIKYKHILVPVWTAQYDYNGKKYRYLVNGQTGRVSGEAPLSPVKIALLVLLGLIVAGVLAYLYYSGKM